MASREGYRAGDDDPAEEEEARAQPKLAAAHGRSAALPAGDATEDREIEQSLGEPLSGILDVRRWAEGVDLAALYDRMREAVAESVAQAERTRGPIRQLLTHRLREKAGQGTAPRDAGLYRMTPDDVASVHRSLLFNGAVECCDGTVVAHDSLLLTVAQIGVSLVAYQGSAGRWVQRLYRRDLRGRFADPLEEAVALLERRSRKDSGDAEETYDPLSRLLRRGLMEYAERAVLLQRASAPWRMGHGNPIPSLILLPTVPALFEANLDVLAELLLGHRKVVYVASSPSDRMVRTLGDAMEPLEYAIIGTIADQFNVARLTDAATQGHPKQRERLKGFLEAVTSEVVYGAYRVAAEAPAQVFYAHKDHAHVAAAIAMADSALQPHRGFPMLIDLADLVCRNTFDASSFAGTVADAYAVAGQPLRYLGERETRGR